MPHQHISHELKERALAHPSHRYAPENICFNISPNLQEILNQTKILHRLAEPILSFKCLTLYLGFVFYLENMGYTWYALGSLSY